MRLVVDSLIALMLIAVLGVLIAHYQQRDQTALNIQFIQNSLADLHEAAVFHGAMGDVPTTKDGFPLEVMPQWFAERLPINILAEAEHPWIDMAPPSDTSNHPPDPVLTSPAQAGFWYNPTRGIFRVRVPMQVTDADTLALYNQLNQTALTTLPVNYDQQRKPLAYTPMTPTRLASVADQQPVKHITTTKDMPGPKNPDAKAYHQQDTAEQTTEPTTPSDSSSNSDKTARRPTLWDNPPKTNQR